MSPHSTSSGALYLGFDLSTQQLKGVAIHSDLTLVHEAKVDFDADFGDKYGVQKGVLANPAEGEIYAPNAMWLEALDLVLTRLKDTGLDFSKVKGISGAGMQHGTVFWNGSATKLLASLDSKKSLVDQLGGLKGAFSHPDSPNWQDASTQRECDEFDSELGDEETLARITGSKAHHRFSGPQVMRFRRKYPEHYANTAHISLVSSFFASIFLGKIAPIDIGDVCGMNLWHIQKGEWHEGLRSLVTEGTDLEGLAKKLGPVPEDGGGSFGNISPYFVEKFGFSESCSIAPFTGDNPSTILSLPLRATDAMVSLGTSTTFLMSTPEYKPDPAYHFMNHPTTAGLYMFMLCYKNGSLAREYVRDAINRKLSTPPAKGDWTAFNQAVTDSSPLLSSQNDSGEEGKKLALYFPRHEIVPAIPPGEWHFTYNPKSKALKPTSTPSPNPKENISATPNPDSPWKHPHDDARAIVESQMLSLRLRSRALVGPQQSADGAELPPQPRRVYLVGGASVNPAIAQVAGEVLGGAEGVFRLELGGNACALGAAYKAAWSCERKVHAHTKGVKEVRGGRDTETFEEFVEARWNEEEFVHKVDQGYRKGVWEQYGEVLDGFAKMENQVLKQTGQKHAEEFPGGGKGLREW